MLGTGCVAGTLLHQRRVAHSVSYAPGRVADPDATPGAIRSGQTGMGGGAGRDDTHPVGRER